MKIAVKNGHFGTAKPQIEAPEANQKASLGFSAILFWVKGLGFRV